MNFMNANANIKQFQLVRFVNENSGEDRVMSKISITLRRDKIEAPYYMVVKVKLSSCIDRPENGLVHAMDMLNHHRRYNLTEEIYNEIRALIGEEESLRVKISESENKLHMSVISLNEDEFAEIFSRYHELFVKIDGLID